MSNEKALTNTNINQYFAQLSKNIKKTLGRHADVEIILVGGSSVLLNYGFREVTMDVDVLISNGQSIKEAIAKTADDCGLSSDWLNTDFSKTDSYTPKLLQHSKFYKCYNQVLTVRTIDDEYLVAMKLKSFRSYKFDWSDIVGIINEMAKIAPVTFEKIDKAVKDLYNDWTEISSEAKDFIQDVMQNQDKLEDFYNIVRNDEIQNKIILQKFDKEYEGKLTSDNLEDILRAITKRENITPSIETLDEKILKHSNNEKLISNRNPYDKDNHER